MSEELEVAYDLVKWGTEMPQFAYMSERAYWQMLRYLNPKLKLPRKMKKRVLGLRKDRKAFNIRMQRMNIGFERVRVSSAAG